MAVLTLTLVVTRPRDLNEGVSALAGAALVLILGLVPWSEAIHQELASWNVFLFFLGMMAIAALADRSGVFDLAAFYAARVARRRVVALYIATFLLGAFISLLFANDSAALVLTPIVYTLVLRLSLDPLPFVFATTFVADTASLGLPVSNPLNVIMVDNFHLSLGSYLEHLWLPALVVLAINLVVFLLLFRRGVRGRIRLMPEPERKPGTASTLGILAALAVAYLVASAFELSLGVVAVAGALALAANQLRLGVLHPKQLATDISWPIFGFFGGMLLVVQGLHDAGITEQLGGVLAREIGTSDLRTIAVTAVGTAFGSNVINNLPMGLVMVSTIHPLHVTPSIRAEMVYATIVGCDLGPNLTHLGSLATFLWLFFLRRKGLEVSTWDYFKIGVIVTPLMLVGAILGLWITSGAH